MSRIDYITGAFEEMRDGDVEAIHARADALLVETVRELVRLPSHYTDDEIERLLAAYEKVPKWYA